MIRKALLHLVFDPIQWLLNKACLAEHKFASLRDLYNCTECGKCGYACQPDTRLARSAKDTSILQSKQIISRTVVLVLRDTKRGNPP